MLGCEGSMDDMQVWSEAYATAVPRNHGDPAVNDPSIKDLYKVVEPFVDVPCSVRRLVG
jgi:hypothetical protein